MLKWRNRLFHTCKTQRTKSYSSATDNVNRVLHLNNLNDVDNVVYIFHSLNQWLQLRHNFTSAQEKAWLDVDGTSLLISLILTVFKLVSYIRGAIKKFLAWPSSVQNKIKILIVASLRRRYAQYMTFELWIYCAFQRMNTVSVRWVSRMLIPNCSRTSQKILTCPSKNLYHN